MSHFFLPIKDLSQRHGLSERRLAENAGVSRGALRSVTSGENCTLKSIDLLARCLDCEVHVFMSPPSILSRYSTVATALMVERDGFESWKIHFFNLVDEFRRTLDPRLLLLPPPEDFDQKLFSLLASIVRDLCQQSAIATPGWAQKRHPLAKPWFVSGMESLKASALIESPLPYRANNIFVHENFLERA